MKTPIFNGYNALSSVSKEIVREAITKQLGYSRATFYNKITDESGLIKNEQEVIKMIIAKELIQQITFSTDALKKLDTNIKLNLHA